MPCSIAAPSTSSRSAHAGARRVYWLTHETNDTARRLYDRLAERSGFIVYRRQL